MSDKPITDFKMVQVQPGSGMVVLDSIGEEDPPYCVHGKTTCIQCGDWCWLGSKTFEIVSAGTAPICITCAKEHLQDATLIEQVHDH